MADENQNSNEITTALKTEIENEALTLMSAEKRIWETSTAFVTEKVAFQMRNLIRQMRKNYYGIFDEPIDPITRREKIWVPLTEFFVDAVVKNTDLDQKDINFRAKKPSAIGLTAIIRAIVRNRLDEIFFGEILDNDIERPMAIDGTVVIKSHKEFGRKFVKKVDLLNFYIDPTADSIAETEAVIERAVITTAQFDKMDGWINKKDVQGTTQLFKNDGEWRLGNSSGGQTKMVETFERWGLMPLFLVTGEKRDKDKEVEGRIVASGLGGKSQLVHLIGKNVDEFNKEVKKPYEEARLKRVPGRWHGRGVGEMLMMLQLWLNIVINVRINKNLISQLGIFKIRRSAGVSPQILSKLAVNGAVLVNSMDDMEQMVMQEANVSSYQDEARIFNWAERVTQAFQISLGEALPSSTTATVGAIQNQNAQSAFVMMREETGLFLQRWLKRQALPLIMEDASVEDIIQVSDDPDALAEIDQRLVDKMVYDQVKTLHEAGKFIDPEQVMQEHARAMAAFKTQGAQRFVKLMKEIDFTEYDTEVYITNEEIDKSALLSNLVQTLQLAPEYRSYLIKEIYDVMGLSMPAGGMKPQPVPGALVQNSQGASKIPANPATISSLASTLQNNGGPTAA